MIPQREKLSELYRRHAGNTERIVRAYANAERRGEVARPKGAARLDADAYARALLAEGLRKGWLVAGR